MDKVREVIELRGHHLPILAIKYFYRKYCGKDIQSRNEEIAYIMDEDSGGPDFALSNKNLYNSLLDNYNKKIKLTAHLDEVCKGCNAREKWCRSKALDMAIIKELGLESEKEYELRYILEKLEEYRKRTGFESPRHKIDSSILSRFFISTKQGVDFIKIGLGYN